MSPVGKIKNQGDDNYDNEKLWNIKHFLTPHFQQHPPENLFARLPTSS
jgi:hypothetical protein